MISYSESLMIIEERNIMYKLILQILEKWACKHKWETFAEHKAVNTKESDEDYIKLYSSYTLICTECGKIKKIKSS